ncbi:DUF506 family protein [Senna tora]|uniref:DUF506 family protein n=1 Tax=Senna tora TaxID=362788 RepID=A0A834WXM5_9FABA|nr:DUF506 family protein [Senna tora]
MGSLEEDQLVQMVQDFIESESPYTANSTSPNSSSLTHQTQRFILEDVLRSETKAEAKVRNYVLKHMRRRKRDSERTTSLRKWLVMSLKMEGLDASLCHTSWATSLGCPAGEYEYIEVNTAEDEEVNDHVRLIVDIDFRSQFELARPTQHYIEMTHKIPVIFVGTEKKLCKIISLLCSAAKQSLREKGLHVPPWRTTSYMQSKWLCGEERSSYDEEGDNNGEIGKWVPPIVKPRKRDLGGGGGSGLSSQFSDMTINCC